MWPLAGGDYYGLVRLLSWTSGWRATRHPNHVINVIPIFYNKYFKWQLFMFHIFSSFGFGGRQRGQIFKIKGRNSALMLERCHCLLNMCSSWSWVNDLREKNKRKYLPATHLSSCQTKIKLVSAYFSLFQQFCTDLLSTPHNIQRKHHLDHIFWPEMEKKKILPSCPLL